MKSKYLKIYLMPPFVFLIIFVGTGLLTGTHADPVKFVAYLLAGNSPNSPWVASLITTVFNYLFVSIITILILRLQNLKAQLKN